MECPEINCLRVAIPHGKLIAPTRIDLEQQTEHIPSMMDAFLHACGVPSALELEVESTSQARSIRFCLRQPFALMGSHPSADIYQPAEKVRPRHVYLQAIEGRIFCINVSQTGSAKTMDKEIKTGCWLKPGQPVQFGTRQFKLIEDRRKTSDSEQEWNDPLSAGSAFDIFGPRLTLEIRDNDSDSITKTWQIDRLITLIGRTSRCAIQLNDDAISNVHASLVLTAHGVFVVDLLGRGGISINGHQVRAGFLDVGDELTIGPFSMKLQPASVHELPFEKNRVLKALPSSDEAFIMISPTENDLHEHAPHSHIPWPEDVTQSAVLRELRDQLQALQGPEYAKYQPVISKMIEEYDQISEDQLQAIRTELQLIREAQQASISQSSVEQPAITDSQMFAPTKDPISKVRPASKLLEESGSSVFRIPIK